MNDINISHESKTKFPVQHCTCSSQGPYRIYKNLLYRTFFTKTLPDLEGHAKRKKENIREEKKRNSDLFWNTFSEGSFLRNFSEGALLKLLYKNLLHKDHLYKDPAGFGRTLKIKKGKRRKDKKKSMHSNMCVGESNFGSAWGLLGRPSKGDLLLEPYTGQGDLLKCRGFVKETFCRSCLLTCV